MPDSLLPPAWDPAPFDDRDLDAVLAGEMTDIPPVLADFLATLKAPATPVELRGEAAAMAGFRALGLGRAAPPAELVPGMRLRVPSGNRRRVARHRSPRARRPGSPLAVAMSAAAAVAAVVVIVVGLTGNLPGRIQRLTGHQAAPSAGHSVAPKAGTQSAAAATAHPEVTSAPAESEASTACRAYFDYLKQSEPPSSWPAEISAWHRLSALAGSQNPMLVYRYCAPYVSGLFPQWGPAIGQNQGGDHQGMGIQGNRGNQGSGF